MLFKKLLYYNFRISHLVKHWVLRHFTRSGIFVLTAICFSAILGINTFQTVTYQVFTFLVSLLIVSLAFGLVFRNPLVIVRKISRFATVGESFRYRVLVENQTTKKQTGLFLMENLTDPRPSFKEFSRAKNPEDKKRNWFDRVLGYPKWVWLMSRKQKAIIQEHSLHSMLPNEKIEEQIEITPISRGYLTFTGVSVGRTDPFGLFKTFREMPLSQSLLVLPKRYQLPLLKFPGKHKYQPGGVNLASSVGESEDFISLRDYQPGDSIRRIHWRSWAKTGKPVIKEYQDEYFVRQALILDTFMDTQYSDIFEEAVSVASSFALSFRLQDALLDLMFVGPEAYCFTTGRGVTQTEKILEILATVCTCQDKSFSTLHHSVLDRAFLLSGCICIFVKWDKERREFINDLKKLDIPLLVFVIIDPRENGGIDAEALEDPPESFHLLEVGKIEQGLAKL